MWLGGGADIAKLLLQIYFMLGLIRGGRVDAENYEVPFPNILLALPLTTPLLNLAVFYWRGLM